MNILFETSEERTVFVNTDQIVWAERGHHSSGSQATLHMSDGKTIQLKQTFEQFLHSMEDSKNNK